MALGMALGAGWSAVSSRLTYPTLLPDLGLFCVGCTPGPLEAASAPHAPWRGAVSSGFESAAQGRYRIQARGDLV